jgi:probable O-glycosylation ligase (exosortase A-associated)
MKQTALMLVLLLAGTGGAIVYGPFIGVAIYYLFAVLRPQYLWEWALVIDLRWSFYVAAATIMSVFIYPSAGLRGKAFTSMHGLMLAFAVWVTLSHLFALNSEISSQWYGEYFKIFVMFFCSSFVVRELIQVRILYLITVWALGYIAYEMNFLYLVAGRLDIYHMGYGGLDNNGAGLMIAMGVPMAYFLWQGYRSWWRWIFLAMVPVMIHAVLMSYSRGAMLSLLLASPLLVLRCTRKAQLVFSILCFLILVPILAGQEIRGRFFSIEEYEQDSSSQSRLDAWNAAWQIMKDYPLLGTGLRNADLLAFQYGADKVGRTIHSQYLQIGADSGFPALTLYLLLFLGTWRRLRRAQKHFRRSTSDSHQLAYNLASGTEGALAVFCIGSVFLSLEVFELPYLMILLALKLYATIQQEETLTAPDAMLEPVHQRRLYVGV